MKFDPDNVQQFFNDLLEPIHDRFIERRMTYSELKRVSGYSYSCIAMTMLNRVYGQRGEARTSQRMATLIDICRSLDLAIVAKSFNGEYDLTEDGYDTLPMEVNLWLKKNKTSLHNLAKISGLSPGVIAAVAKENGLVSRKVGIIQYMRLYHTLISPLTITVPVIE